MYCKFSSICTSIHFSFIIYLHRPIRILLSILVMWPDRVILLSDRLSMILCIDVFAKLLIVNYILPQAVSRRPLTAEARDRARFTTRICGCFSPSSSVFPCHYHSTVSQKLSGWWTIGPFVTVVQRHSLTPRTWTITTWPRYILVTATLIQDSRKS
jgi:hypothetical protein